MASLGIVRKGGRSRREAGKRVVTGLIFASSQLAWWR